MVALVRSPRLSLIQVVRTVCLTVIVLVTTYVVFTWGPILERMFYPVVGRLTITDTEAVTPDQTRIWVQFEKLRECAPLEVYWYLGTRAGSFERVNFRVERPLDKNKYANRPLGVQRSGPWLVNIPIGDIAMNAFSEAHHSCNPLWITKSKFYN